MNLKALLLLLFSTKVLAAGQLTVIGDAYDLAGEKLLYQEYHYYSADNLDHTVVYRNTENQDIAIKNVDYRFGMISPAFQQRSLQYPEELSVSMADDDLLIRYLQGDSAVKEGRVNKKQPLVIDAGFDHYIREHWEALTNKQLLTFYFPAVTRQSLVKLRVTPRACSYPTNTDRCFSINSASWIIRLILDPIELGYDKNTQQLSRFRGLANLTDERGDGLVVDIKYRYADLCDPQTDCVLDNADTALSISR